jgi:Phosphorylated CTD interacting factor 1 WW domain
MGDSTDGFKTVNRKGKRSEHAKPETKPKGRHEDAEQGPPGVRNPPVHANPKKNEIDELRKENIVWNIRYREVKKLIDFVNRAMDKKDFKVYVNHQYNERKTLEKKLSKAGQYVYLHYIAGRLSDKIKDEYDPLFCVRNDDHEMLDDYEDPILSNHLKAGDYAKFKELEQEAYDVVSSYKISNALVHITWKDIISDYQKYPINKYGINILQKLQDEAHLKYGYPNQEEDKTLPKLGEGNQLVVENIIGLTLRYLCIGGFTDAIHSAIPDQFKDILPECVECFASPLNRKLKRWFSFFARDTFFGSEGNFFTVCADNGDKLPPDLKLLCSVSHAFLEINPCWCNSIYEHLAEILKNSAEDGVKAIILGPDWHDKPDKNGESKYAGQENKWAEKFDNLRKSPNYVKTSAHGEKRIDFTIDTSGSTHTQKTKYWIISDVKIPDEIKEGLQKYVPESDKWETSSSVSMKSTISIGREALEETIRLFLEDPRVKAYQDKVEK